MFGHFTYPSINQHLLPMLLIMTDLAICTFCQEAEVVMKCAKVMALDEHAPATLKPLKCGTCQSRFPDTTSLESHVNSVHFTGIEEQRTTKSTEIHPKSMKVADLKKEHRYLGIKLCLSEGWREYSHWKQTRASWAFN